MKEIKQRKRIAKDITFTTKGYIAWRRFDVNMDMGKISKGFVDDVTGKIRASPKDIVSVFGYPT